MVEIAPRARRPVQTTADRLRDMIFAAQPDTRIGSLSGLAGQLGVGIVTVQQAARILEHEGLLEVRRGPGGGYYGQRPGAEALERSLAAYLRSESASWAEVLDMTSLLFNELAAAAARCADESLRAELRDFLAKVEAAPDEPTTAGLEGELQDLLFRMVDRPLFEMLTRVTLGIASTRSEEDRRGALFALRHWKTGRRRIIAAILEGDEELARFEANRQNRRVLMRGLE
jgi:DNA-binding FadR family transcriptional regulator